MPRHPPPPSPPGARGLVRRGEIARVFEPPSSARTSLWALASAPIFSSENFLCFSTFSLRASSSFTASVFADATLATMSSTSAAAAAASPGLRPPRPSRSRSLLQFTILRHAFLRLDHRPLQRTLGGDEPLANESASAALSVRCDSCGTQRVQFGGDRGETRCELGGDDDATETAPTPVPVLFFGRGRRRRTKMSKGGGRRGGRLGGGGGRGRGRRLPRRRRRRQPLRDPSLVMMLECDPPPRIPPLSLSPTSAFASLHRLTSSPNRSISAL